MTIRPATPADLPELLAMCREFEAEVPEPPHREPDSEDETRTQIERLLEDGLVLLAEDAAGPVGFALASLQGPRICFLDTLHVRPRGRRRRVATALAAEVSAWAALRGAEFMTLEVLATNTGARALYDRLGFREESLNLVVPLGELDARARARGDGPT
jgi:ribosomal protein S18 acetylase RimI-like enzyme